MVGSVESDRMSADLATRRLEPEVENPVRSVILASAIEGQIMLRARRSDDSYPTHDAFRILIGYTIHTVRACDAIGLQMTLRFDPHDWRKRCPDCQKADWAVWVPAPICRHQIWDGDIGHPTIYTELQWYFLCRHCKRMVWGHERAIPYGLRGIKEYVYDPADDIELVFGVKRRRHATVSRAG